ncbi:MAG: class I SAM-dependent methyltransferase, partial [bacterium]|nr:class I SAM-dependent methyltransferase [bacterium]
PPGYYDNRVYRDAAGSTPKNVLEFASGSGRLLLQLAGDGHNITGVELSGDMIKLCKEKMIYLEPEATRGVTIVQGDMTTVNIGSKFDLIFLAICTLCLLHTTEQKQNFFANVKRHLAPDGIFLFDHQIYDLEKAAKHDESIEFIPINTGYPKHYMLMGEKVLMDEQRVIVNFYNEIIEQDGSSTKYLGKTNKKMIDMEEIENLIRQNGMEIVKTDMVPIESGFLKAIKHYYCRLAQ